MAPTLYLLDSNIIVHYVRRSPLWGRIRDNYNLFARDPIPEISIVTVGEILSLSLQWNWGIQKQAQMNYCLGYFQKISIADPEILTAYARIDAYCESIGRPMGKNDLWIAATAASIGATLLTTDRDFDHLTPQFLARDWIDPNTP